MTRSATQDVINVQYQQLLECAVIQQVATDDQVLLAQQIQQVRVVCTTTNCIGVVATAVIVVLSTTSFSVQAYGPTGLGILTVSGVPGFAELRQRLLPLAQEFAVRCLGAACYTFPADMAA